MFHFIPLLPFSLICTAFLLCKSNRASSNFCTLCHNILFLLLSYSKISGFLLFKLSLSLKVAAPFWRIAMGISPAM
ncbi:hypothetical protein O6P43_026095 [Quillaja saponaria]|uniref:Uncharacterized protein n=1 Tax=Quillaja saponaria TaxID=32244 RepID=A0AAD7PGA2_QUISA|nr:hypothetical protein O6P43_026095 [Quillaja saponaria]